MARRQSAERGRDMMMSEEKKRMEEIGRQAGDLGNAVKEMRAAGEGGVDRGVREAARQRLSLAKKPSTWPAMPPPSTPNWPRR